MMVYWWNEKQIFIENARAGKKPVAKSRKLVAERLGEPSHSLVAYYNVNNLLHREKGDRENFRKGLES